MQGLYSNDLQEEPTPLLAKSSHFSADGLTLEIELKRGIVWKDGKPLTAQNFVDSFERLLDPRLNSPNASLLFDVKGARDFFFGKIRKFKEVGVQAPHTNQIRLVLNEPRADFLRILTHWSTYPIRKDQPTLTLGPYSLKDETPPGPKHTHWTLVLNPKFHGPKPAFSELNFETIQSGKEALDLYEHQKLDYLLQVEDQLLKTLPPHYPGLGIASRSRVVALLHLNSNRTNTNTPEKRRAIMAALPVDSLLDPEFHTRIAASSIIPTSAGQTISNARLNAESTSNLPDESLTLGYPDDAFSKAIAEQLQSKSKRVKLKIEAMPSNDREASKRYDLVFNLFGLDFDDPDQILSAFLTQGTLDLFNANSSELLDLIQRARQSDRTKPGESEERYAKAADYLQNQVALVMPLFYRQRTFLLNTSYHFIAGSEGNPNSLFLKNK